MAEKTMVEAVRDAMFEEMKRDERIILMGEDVGQGGVFRASEGFVAEFGEDRCMDTPLAESCIVGAAIGASLNGIIPIAELSVGAVDNSLVAPAGPDAARRPIASSTTRGKRRRMDDFSDQRGGAAVIPPLFGSADQGLSRWSRE